MNETTEDMVNETPETFARVETRPRRRRFLKYKVLGLAALIVGLIAGGFFYYRYTKTPEYAQKKADQEAVVLVEKVSKHMILPEGKPAIFVVSDPDMLAGQQAFFKGSEKGDSLLVYPEAGKAIVYSSKRDLIVNVGPVTFDKDKLKQVPIPTVLEPIPTVLEETKSTTTRKK